VVFVAIYQHTYLRSLWPNDSRRRFPILGPCEQQGFLTAGVTLNELLKYTKDNLMSTVG